MALPVKLSDIKMEEFRYEAGKDQVMLPGEIPGASVLAHSLSSGDTLFYPGQQQFIRIFFLCDGSLSFEANSSVSAYSERAYFAAKPQDDITIRSDSPSTLLEIRWQLNESDLADLAEGNIKFPLTGAYKDAMQYRDFFKSETTISRAVIPQTFIPRFAMGTVEMKGDDLVGQHAHPLLDQFFFSFPENDMDLLIDCRICHMGGNTLLHIPLGSNHGVITRGNQKAHYLWIDCTPQDQKDEAVAYLNEVHKPTGEKATLE